MIALKQEQKQKIKNKSDLSMFIKINGRIEKVFLCQQLKKVYRIKDQRSFLFVCLFVWLGLIWLFKKFIYFIIQRVTKTEIWGRETFVFIIFLKIIRGISHFPNLIKISKVK